MRRPCRPADAVLGSRVDQLPESYRRYLVNGIRRELGFDAPRAAEAYLDEWASDSNAWLRKFYPTGSDEAHFDLEGMGFEFKSFVFQAIQDSEGYLDSLGQPKIQEALKNARIATALSDREAKVEEESAPMPQAYRPKGHVYPDPKSLGQAIDAGGKDGTIRRVFGGVNPQGCDVHAFKQPGDEDVAQDFGKQVADLRVRSGDRRERTAARPEPEVVPLFLERHPGREAADQHVGRIVPQRLGVGVAQIAAREADVRQHVVIETGQGGGGALRQPVRGR